MTDVRQEWISKRAYSIWEEAGRPHGQDTEHWEQAAREREEFERVALTSEAKPGVKKPLIEISEKAKAKKPAVAKPKKADGVEKPLPVKTAAKTKAASTNGKQA